jgi:integrase
MRKPFYKKSHKAWYCEIDRKQIRLSTDKGEAFDEYHRLMAGHIPATSRTPAVVILDQFLAWTGENRSARTLEWYLMHIESFAEFIGSKVTASQVKPNHVTRWLERRFPTASPTTRNGACRAVSRAFNWARKQGLISDNPVSGFERPAAEPREAYINDAQWGELMTAVPPGNALHDLLVFLYETGSRPQEARIVEARHWDRTARRLTLERQQSKGKRSRRVIRLNVKATEIINRLAVKYPNGPLFRNGLGNPWKSRAISARFCKLEKKLGFEVFAYALRHTFITNALLRGVDPLTCAIFAGHKDASMIMKVYSHLVQQDDFLASKLQQATGEVVA